MSVELKNKPSITQAFSALADDNRLRIFELLVEHEDICVSAVAESISMSVSGAWQHLKVLESASLVEEYKIGRKTCHKLIESKRNRDIIRLIKSKG